MLLSLHITWFALLPGSGRRCDWALGTRLVGNHFSYFPGVGGGDPREMGAGKEGSISLQDVGKAVLGYVQR